MENLNQCRGQGIVQERDGFNMTILGANLNPFQRVKCCLKFQQKLVVFSEITYKRVIYRPENV